MKSQRLSIVVSCIFLFAGGTPFAPSQALAATPSLDHAAEATDNPSDWAIGAGLLTRPGNAADQGAPGLGSAQDSIGGTATLEKRISDAIWLPLEIHGGYVDWSDEETGRKVSAKVIGLDAGVRMEMLKVGAVTFSAFGAIGGSYSKQQQSGPDLSGANLGAPVPSSSRSYTLRAKIGGDVQYALAEQVFLRLSSSVLNGSFSRTRLDQKNDPLFPALDYSVWRASISFEPELAVRLEF